MTCPFMSSPTGSPSRWSTVGVTSRTLGAALACPARTWFPQAITMPSMRCEPLRPVFGS